MAFHQGTDVAKYLEVFLRHTSSSRQPPDHLDMSLAHKILEELVKADRWTDIDFMFDQALAPNIEHYREIEGIRRIEISRSMRRGEYEKACKLMKTGTFRDGSDLVPTWDECQYKIQEHKSGRLMTSLTRYRIRDKYPPPKSICPLRVRPKKTLSTKTRSVLAKFFEENTKYPSTDQKMELADATGLTKTQVHNWFGNRRRKRMADSRRKQEEATNSTARVDNVLCSHGDNVHVGRDMFGQFQVLGNNCPQRIGPSAPNARLVTCADQTVPVKSAAEVSTTGFHNSDSYLYCRYQAGVMETLRPHPWQDNHPGMSQSVAYMHEQKMSSKAMYAASPQEMVNQPQCLSGNGAHGSGGHLGPVHERYGGWGFQEQHGYPNPLTMLHTAAEFVSSLDVDGQQLASNACQYPNTNNADCGSDITGRLNMVQWRHPAPDQKRIPVHTYTFDSNNNSHQRYGNPSM